MFGDQERHAECRAVCMNQLRAESEHYRVSMFLFSLTSQFTDQQSHVYFILVRAIRLTAICLFAYLPIYLFTGIRARGLGFVRERDVEGRGVGRSHHAASCVGRLRRWNVRHFIVQGKFILTLVRAISMTSCFVYRTTSSSRFHRGLNGANGEFIL